MPKMLSRDNDAISVNGKEDIAKYVKLFTEIQGDPPTAPFHWQEWNDGEGAEKSQKRFAPLIISFPF